MSVPMGALFRACCDVLWRELRPIHYADLARLAVESIGYVPSEVDGQRTKEDVREKLLEARARGTFYTHGPHFCGAMRDWFREPQRLLFNPDEVASDRHLIPASLSASGTACLEAVMRCRTMLTKVADTPARWIGLTRGLMIEQHVSDYFRREWPEHWAPPDNAGRYDRPCEHDFKLEVPDRLLRVDVMGPRRDGTFGTPSGGGKRPADLHVLASIEGNAVRINGFYTGEALSEQMSPWTTQPFSRLAVWLNCFKHGFSYGDLCRAAGRKAR